MKTIDKIYLINLERSTDRLEHFMDEVKKHSIPLDKLQIFKAIDATTHEFTADESVLLGHISHEIKTVQCNFLSHYYCWKDSLEKGYRYTLILQDDVYFVNDICDKIDNIVNHLPNDSEIVNLGLHYIAIRNLFIDFPIHTEYDRSFYTAEEDIVNDYICKWKKDVNPASLAYIINCKNAMHIFDRFSTIRNAMDGFLNEYCISKNIMYGSRDILATGNSKFKSTVFEGNTFIDLLSMYNSHVSS
jgi:GR25 family glycosyltransferase involved in LPS biosynthesis